MEVKNKIPYIYCADFETSYIDEKQQLKGMMDKEGRNKLKETADRERYVYLAGISDMNGNVKYFCNGKNTLIDFHNYVCELLENNFKENPKADTQIYFHNLKYDWSYYQSYLCNHHDGIKRGTKHTSYKECRTDGMVYRSYIYKDESIKENKKKKKGDKQYQIFNQYGEEVKKYNCKTVTLLDSYKLFPISIKQMGEIVGLPKLEEGKNQIKKVFTYNDRPNQKEIEYCLRDVEIMVEFIKKAPAYAMRKSTLASNSLQLYKDITFPLQYGEKETQVFKTFDEAFPNIYFNQAKLLKGEKQRQKINVRLGNLQGKFTGEKLTMHDVNKIIQVGYTGGVTQVNLGYFGKMLITENYINKNKIIEKLKEENRPYILTNKSENILDVNSLYPSTMLNADIPYGIPSVIDFPHEKDLMKYALEDKLVIIEVTGLVGKLNNNFCPSIPKSRCHKINSAELYLNDLDYHNMIVNYKEFLLHKKHYDIYGAGCPDGYTILRAIVFNTKRGLFFNKYLNMFAEQKEKASKIINEYKRDKNSHTYQEYLDALYDKQMAKLFMNTLYGKFGSNPEKVNEQKYYDTKEEIWKKSINEEYYKDENDEKHYIEQYSEFIYPAVASSITSNARLTLFNLIDKIPYKYFIYSDTDSVHFIDNEIYGINEMLKDGLIDDNILGKWKLEDVSNCSIYLAPKKYAFIDKDGNLIVKCAGLPDDAKDKIENITQFYYGYTSKSKTQTLYVKGGIDIIETRFIISYPKEINNKYFDENLNDYLTFYI